MTEVVVFGSFGRGALEGFLADGFETCGATVTRVRYGSLPVNRYVRRAVAPVAEPWARRADRRSMRAPPPANLVLCMKPALWGAREVRRLRSAFRSARLAAYLPDDPVAAMHGGHFRPRAVDALREWDVVLTWTRAQEPVLRGAGVRDVRAVAFGWAPEHRASAQQLEMTPTHDVSFVGSWDPDRQQTIAMLATRLPSVRFIVRGPRWPMRGMPGNVSTLSGPVFDADMITSALSASVSLNIPRRQNVGNHNMRLFELAAMGAVQVVTAPWSVRGPGSPMAVPISDLEELLPALATPSRLIAERQRCWTAVETGASYADRAMQLLGLL